MKVLTLNIDGYEAMSNNGPFNDSALDKYWDRPYDAQTHILLFHLE